MRNLYKIAALCLVIQFTGLHWMALQCLAWANMAVKYSQKAGLITGLDHTFDGAHPCPMCRAIVKGTTTEKKKTNSSTVSSTKLQVFLAKGSPFFYQTRQIEGRLEAKFIFCPMWTEAPPVPPPRYSWI